MDNNTIYKMIKAEMAQERENIKGFTFKFFEKYLTARNQRITNMESGVDDSYKDGHVTRYHCYDEIYNDNFYIKNGGAYCLFLQLIQQYVK